jgi:hypothetical protein
MKFDGLQQGRANVELDARRKPIDAIVFFRTYSEMTVSRSGASAGEIIGRQTIALQNRHCIRPALYQEGHG